MISFLNCRFRLFSLDSNYRNNFLILLFLKTHFPNFSYYQPCFSILILHSFSLSLNPIKHPFLFYSGLPWTVSVFPKKEPFHLWPWLTNHLILAPMLCSLNLFSVYLPHYRTMGPQHWGPNKKRIPRLQSKTSCTYPFFPCPSPHHLGTQLNPVIFIIFPGSSNLLAFLSHFILSPLLSADTLLKFLLNGEQ